MTKHLKKEKNPLFEDQRYSTDFYSYFEAEENGSRYLPAVGYLRHKLADSEAELLDIGCGNGALCIYLPDRFRCLGIDHSQSAIDYCRRRYPGQRFEKADVLEAISGQLGSARYNVVFLSGVLGALIDQKTLTPVDDREVVNDCLAHCLNPGGFLVILGPFRYGETAETNLMAKAIENRAIMQDTLSDVDAKTVFETLSLQHGIEQVIAAQEQLPERFVRADFFDPNDRTSWTAGQPITHLATWTVILRRGG